MSTVNCYGVHSDEVGLRYLVQDTITNAYGFSKQEPFEVETTFGHGKCPHRHKITKDKKGSKHRAAWVASPVPLPLSGSVAHRDEDIGILAAFSGAHIIPAWMINAHTLKARLFVSNITTLIIPNCTFQQADMLNEIQSGLDTYTGKVIFQGDFYFDSRMERLPKLPEDLTVKEAKRIGLANMSNYLRATDSQGN